MNNFFENPWDKENNDLFDNSWSSNTSNSNKWSKSNESLLPTYLQKAKNLDDIEIASRKDITIIIDPGHGGSTGNTGALFTKGYEYYLKGDGDEVYKKDDKGNKIIKKSTHLDIPSYLDADFNQINHIADWDNYGRIKASSKSKVKWLIRRNMVSFTNDILTEKSERAINFKVAEKLKIILTNAGYNVLLTKKAFNTGLSLKDRNKFTNSKTDYFISIHADGSNDYRKKGGHSIYREGSVKDYNERQKEFAKDVMNFYNVVTLDNDSPKNDVRKIRVLSVTENKAVRKTLVELGYVSNPTEYNTLNSNVDTIATQLAKGIELNISKKYFKKETTIIGFSVNGKKFKNLKEAEDWAYDLLFRSINSDEVDAISGASIQTKPEPIYSKNKTKVYLKPTI